MGRPKYHDKPDRTKSAIVEALEKAGCIVRRDTDVDAKVTHPTWPKNIWRLVEIKVANRKDGSYRLRKDQEAQNEFVAAYGVPRLTSPEMALAWLRSVHHGINSNAS